MNTSQHFAVHISFRCFILQITELIIDLKSPCFSFLIKFPRLSPQKSCTGYIFMLLLHIYLPINNIYC